MAQKNLAADKVSPAPNTSQKKIQINNDVQRAVSNAGYSQSTINKVASIVVKHSEDTNFASNVHNELRETYSDYLDLYKIVKPIISQFSSPSTTPKNSDTSKLDQEISETLCNSGIQKSIRDYVISFVSQHHNEQNAKQVIYRGIVAKYGQKQGLDIYRHIKKKL